MATNCIYHIIWGRGKTREVQDVIIIPKKGPG